ncbi:DNA polymerase III subunit delta [Romeria aff. gracilis LEGE 07310]|uniref:DNA polymerase III subunit delta n=1 Tax=Vasconcelosia minhoensis LEGE 07310 TaxID=915328 RepID=A0A8J7AFI5_9CYAN|nr:DNA polymerase III subunit delta [Romeria gracilis]MBE9078059.1 DNA polymerase III subunit delta [Romeria aff. gracilis LEGE 07310]
MPVYFFWGSDEFRLKQAVQKLRDRVLDPAWASFNYDKLPAESLEQALEQALTPPFGAGQRLVWLADTPIAQRCSEPALAALARTLPAVLETTTLLLTSGQKPDGRLKSTKLLKKYGEVREFASFSPWQTQQIEQQVKQMAEAAGLSLQPAAVARLAEAVGADTRQLANELEKLSLYWADCSQPLTPEAVSALVANSAQSSLQLAAALRLGQPERALALAAELVAANEPVLKIVATLVGQFRRWLWVKLMTETGERDFPTLAKAAEIGNPARVYYLQQEVRSLSLAQLQQALEILLSLEYSFKRGAADQQLQTAMVELSTCLRNR